ncbi:hypothetical protein [Arthrobacter sp. CAL618]|uniref:hypothetical protein n=1 Tax=Arthrobacter sp. CAL618 TaxID=1055770 RepID=UPI0012ECA484|nr:hypothetical protein [Arthrobacter sp. CAL618]
MKTHTPSPMASATVATKSVATNTGATRESPRERSMAAHPSASHLKLRILVTTDADLDSVHIHVHGCVSPVSIHGLDLLVRRASALSPDTSVILDLSEAQAWDSLRADLQGPSILARLQPTLSAPGRLRLRVIPPPD